MAKNKTQSASKVVHDSKLIDVSKKPEGKRPAGLPPRPLTDGVRPRKVLRAPRRHRRGNASMGGLA